MRSFMRSSCSWKVISLLWKRWKEKIEKRWRKGEEKRMRQRRVGGRERERAERKE